jgi:hypothetical protein
MKSLIRFSAEERLLDKLKLAGRTRGQRQSQQIGSMVGKRGKLLRMQVAGLARGSA